MDAVASFIQSIIVSLIIGGGLWKGLDSISRAMSQRAAAKLADHRLAKELVDANYDKAMLLINQQAKRIDTLHDDIESERRARLQREMEYQKKIDDLETENACLRSQLHEIRIQHRKLQEKYDDALERIGKLEKGDTGPLKAP